MLDNTESFHAVANEPIDISINDEGDVLIAQRIEGDEIGTICIAAEQLRLIAEHLTVLADLWDDYNS